MFVNSPMGGLARLLALPTSLLTLTASTAAEGLDARWPHNLPRSARYYPEDEAHVRRDVEAQGKLAWQAPIGMKKMGDDPGEKFFLHYWEFDDTAHQERLSPGGELGAHRLAHHEELATTGNASLLLPALSRHTNYVKTDNASWVFFARSLIARDFECPAGTRTCSNIQSDLCCQETETCVNTPEGVGCCPQGVNCGNAVGACDTTSGYTACPDDRQGGCCIPGASCVQGGCAFYGTATVIRTLPASTATTRPSSTAGVGPTTIVVSESGLTTTITVTASGEDRTETVTITQPTTIIVAGTTGSACTPGFQSCPASLGGGCCRSAQICGTSRRCIDVTSPSSATAAPPVRPTGSDTSVSAADSTEPATESTGAVGCPTGYYMCSAVYLGGCCQVDRNCDTTSCPAQATTDVVTSGLTIAAGGGQAASPTGQCPNAWSSCPADVGGGCCPSGYLCSSNCINAAPGGSNTSKQAPNSAVVVAGFAWSFAAAALSAATMMIWL